MTAAAAGSVAIVSLMLSTPSGRNVCPSHLLVAE